MVRSVREKWRMQRVMMHDRKASRHFFTSLQRRFFGFALSMTGYDTVASRCTSLATR